MPDFVLLQIICNTMTCWIMALIWFHMIGGNNSDSGERKYTTQYLYIIRIVRMSTPRAGDQKRGRFLHNDSSRRAEAIHTDAQRVLVGIIFVSPRLNHWYKNRTVFLSFSVC